MGACASSPSPGSSEEKESVDDKQKEGIGGATGDGGLAGVSAAENASSVANNDVPRKTPAVSSQTVSKPAINPVAELRTDHKSQEKSPSRGLAPPDFNDRDDGKMSAAPSVARKRKEESESDAHHMNQNHNGEDDDNENPANPLADAMTAAIAETEGRREKS